MPFAPAVDHNAHTLSTGAVNVTGALIVVHLCQPPARYVPPAVTFTEYYGSHHARRDDHVSKMATTSARQRALLRCMLFIIRRLIMAS
jgi:hypothetical protein